MKKLLIIQQDDAYFLFETLQVIEKNQSSFKELELTILVDEKAYKEVYKDSLPILKCLTTNSQSALTKEFDLSVNLSLKDSSWPLHGQVKSAQKIGPYMVDGQLIVHDDWSSFLLTLKAKAPFLTYHLQDCYKNILGLRAVNTATTTNTLIKKIAFGQTAVHLFSGAEQEILIHELARLFPFIPIEEISEIDLVSDVSHTLYIGPANLEALKFCEAGGKGIFLSSHFKGFNFLPYSEGNIVLSSRGERFKAEPLVKFISKVLNGINDYQTEYSVYTTTHENIFGAHLQSMNNSDDNYPFYQSHVVLWNFLLNLFDTNLEVIKCNDSQVNLLKFNYEVLAKFLRLHDYAMVSVDTIFQETKSQQADGLKIEGHMKNLSEIDALTDQIAVSHSFLRPVLDFYRIRRGQNQGENLSQLSQSSLLTYSEEHQALQALHELFSVTLKKNEVNI